MQTANLAFLQLDRPARYFFDYYEDSMHYCKGK